MPTLTVSGDRAGNFFLPSSCECLSRWRKLLLRTSTSSSKLKLLKSPEVCREHEPCTVSNFHFNLLEEGAVGLLFKLYWFRRTRLGRHLLHFCFAFSQPGRCVVQMQSCLGRFSSLLKGSLPSGSWGAESSIILSLFWDVLLIKRIKPTTSTVYRVQAVTSHAPIPNQDTEPMQASSVTLYSACTVLSV